MQAFDVQLLDKSYVDEPQETEPSGFWKLEYRAFSNLTFHADRASG